MLPELAEEAAEAEKAEPAELSPSAEELFMLHMETVHHIQSAQVPAEARERSAFHLHQVQPNPRENVKGQKKSQVLKPGS